MAWGPAPCLSMWRKPRVLGWAGASRAATPEPEGWALIVLGFSLLARDILSHSFDASVAFPFERTPRFASNDNPRCSAAATGAAAVFAFVASAVGHHEHAALATGRRAFMGIGRLERRRHPVRPTTCRQRRSHSQGRSEERRVGKECRSRWSPHR